MPDPQSIAAAAIAFVTGITGTIATVMKLAQRRRKNSPFQDATNALIRQAESNAVLAARFDAAENRAEESHKQLNILISQFRDAATQIRNVVVRLETLSQIDANAREQNLEDPQTRAAQKVRTKLARISGANQRINDDRTR